MPPNNTPSTLAETCCFNVIYVYRITESKIHKNLLKIGIASLKNVPAAKTPNDFQANCSELKETAEKRIKKQTVTAGLFRYVEILHAELAVDNQGKAFRDKDVHRVLKNSGIPSEKIMKPAQEWFHTDLETAKEAISAAKNGVYTIQNITTGKTPVEFRPEQKRAISETISVFRNPGTRFLWNAKMRFGKTLSALEVVKRKEFKRTIIITHRPAVEDGWFEDFKKVFYESDTPYTVGGREKATFEELESDFQKHGKKYVYFASMQDLRGSEAVAGDSGFDKNLAVFKADWDCVIIDEAHEGTQTTLGKNVLAALQKTRTCTLSLSGTPFNVIGEFKEFEIFTWDYIMEQRAKQEWEETHPGEPNPYASLPRMNIRTYELGNALNNPAFVEVEDKAFSFSEFFRVNESNEFVYKNDIKKFLDLLVGKSPNTQYYPFANEEFRAQFRHSFWIVPGVKEAKCLEELLKKHDVFSSFEVVNVAGEGNSPEDIEEKDALSRVKTAIGTHNYTITLSCGRLTTGVTVPEWTAILYLAGGYKTSPMSYMQTIFRVQSPGSVNGRAKEECYAFDFAPDRIIAIVEQVAQVSAGTDKKAREREKRVCQFISEFTNFAPIIAYSGSETKSIDTDYVLKEIKKICIAQVVRNGFASPKLFNNKLWYLTDDEVNLFKKLEGKIGKHSKTDSPTEVVINVTGATGQSGQGDGVVTGGENPPKTTIKPQTSDQEKERRKKREIAIAVLTNAAVRVPLLVFGADGDVNKTFTSKSFTKHFDDKSWEEFMGKLSKEDFKKTVAPFLEETVFSGACSRIRERVLSADRLPVLERLRKIVEIHSEFKNPDKETVLTPWRVVNAQISETLGGYKFFDTIYTKDERSNPLFVNNGDVTQKTLGTPNSKILELNSKTGLYPLFVAYSLMRAQFEARPPRRGESAEKCFRDSWFNVIKNNLFVVCKTKMAAAITRRTLVGFNSRAKTNIITEENIVALIKNPKTLPKFAKRLRASKTWKKTGKNMNFNAIVGNPPYQQSDGGAQASASPVYQHFVRLAKALEPEYISLIMPARWYSGGKGLDDFREEMLGDRQIRRLVDYFDSSKCFPGVEIKGGVCYLLWEHGHNSDCEIVSNLTGKQSTMRRPLRDEGSKAFIRFNEAVSIVQKVVGEGFEAFSTLTSARKPFGLGTNAVGKARSAGRRIKLYANKKLTGANGYISQNEIPEKHEWIDKHKVLITRAYGAGNTFPHQILNVPFYAEPNSACTETYLVIGPFENKGICENVMSYIKTKFFRFLVLLKKNTQDATQNVYTLVPMQDFSKPWTDAELYEKYKLTADETAFIESMIRPMP